MGEAYRGLSTPEACVPELAKNCSLDRMIAEFFPALQPTLLEIPRRNRSTGFALGDRGCFIGCLTPDLRSEAEGSLKQPNLPIIGSPWLRPERRETL